MAKSAILLPAFVAFFFVSAAQAEESRNSLAAIDALSKYGQIAERDASIAVNDCHLDGHCGFHFRNYTVFYRLARNGFDSLIAEMVAELDRSGEIDRSARVNHLVQLAANQFSILRLSSENKRAFQVIGGFGATQFDVGQTFQQSVSDIQIATRQIGRLYKVSGPSCRAQIAELLYGARWRLFEEIRRNMTNGILESGRNVRSLDHQCRREGA